MSVFNRLVVVIVSIAILSAAVVTALVAAGVSTPDVLLYGWFESQLQTVANASGSSVAGIIAISVAIALGMIAILFFEIVPLRTPTSFLISSTQEGIITIDIESVCALAEATRGTIHSVRNIKCSIRESAEGLLISCRASVVLGTNMPEVGAELQSKIKESVEHFTSLPVAQVDIKLRYESVEARRLAVR